MKTVATSGGFDPLHDGHVDLFRRARALGDRLVVVVESDDWVRRKHKVLMPQAQRAAVIRELRCVDEVLCNPDPTGNSGPLVVAAGASVYAVGADHPDSSVLPEWPSLVAAGVSVVPVGDLDTKRSSSAMIAGVQWDNPTVLVAALVCMGDYVLLANRAGTDEVEISGGFVEPGETLEDALRREIKEELDLGVCIGRYFESLSGRYGDGREIVVAAFLVSPYPATWMKKFKPTKEVSGVSWIKSMPDARFSNEVDRRLLEIFFSPVRNK